MAARNNKAQDLPIAIIDLESVLDRRPTSSCHPIVLSATQLSGSNGIDRDHYHRFTGPMVQWMHRRLRGHFYKTNIIKCRGENFFVVFVADNIQFVMPVGEVKSIVQRSVLIMGA